MSAPTEATRLISRALEFLAPDRPNWLAGGAGSLPGPIKMRFSSRQGTSEQELNATTADVVLQLGEAKIPIKAEKLLGATVRVSRSNQNLAGEQRQSRSPYERAQNDEDKAIEALSRMQEDLSWTHTGAAAGGGKWPWSPDDLYPSDSKLYQPTQHGNHHTPGRLRREPSDANLPAYYDPTEQPYYVSQQTSASAVRDMALHKGVPNIFDNIGETPQRRLSLTAMKQHEVSRRSKTTGHGPRPRKLDLVQLFPQPRPSTGRLLSPSRLQHSPSAMTDRADYPLPPLPHESFTLNSKKSGMLDTSSVRPSTAASGVAGKNRTFDEDIFDQHKTNVRRPPKGIQNWFDAFLDTDEDEDEDEEAIDEGPEPQELPADEIQPPAYHPPSREVSRASQKSVQPPAQRPQSVTQQTQSLDPMRHERPALERMHEHEDSSGYRSTSDCHSWDSIQSSHLGQTQPAAVESQVEVESNSRAGQSVLSLSDSDYDEDLEDNSSGSQVKDRPTIRDSIMDYRHVTVGAASRVGVQKLHQRPQQLQAIRSLSHESQELETKRSSSRTSVSNTTPHQTQKPLPMEPHEEMHPTAEQVALRRLHGLSLESSVTNNSIGEQPLRSTPSSELPSDAAHMMAVTEEEMMLLDLMRRKRAMMQQMSFTEGYQLALQTEQQRLAKRTESAQKNAMKALQRKENERRDSQISSSRGSPTVTQSDSDMRRHLSAIRKEQVDERFQIERFLGMSQPQPLSSHPPDLEMPPELPKSKRSSSTKSREPSGELLPTTVYSPAATPTGRSPATQGSLPSSDDNDSDSVKRRVDHFIATNGAVPPLNTTLKTMRKKSSRTPASMPPSPVIEEGHAPPAVPVRSPARTKRHQRDASDQSWQLHHKISSVSMDTDAEPRDKSPVSTFFSRKDSTNDGERALSPDEEHCTPLLPNKPGAEFADPNSLQRTQTLVSAMTSSLSMSTMSPISPFSSIISAASAAPKPLTPQSRQASAYTPDTEYSQYSRSTPSGGATAQVAHVVNLSGGPTARGLNVERKRPLPPPLSQLNTIDAALEGRTINKHGSLMSITSAGEDVLAAWKDLGGGSDCLRTKKRVANRPSGGLGEVAN